MRKYIRKIAVIFAVCISLSAMTGVSAFADDTSWVTEEVMHTFMQSIINSVTTPDMTDDEKLRACYDFVLDWMTYSRDEGKPVGNWTKDWALEAFWSGKGNCYRYASTFGYLAKELGYDVRICTGQCTSSKGGWTPHGWTEILSDDGTYRIYDLSFGDANRGKRNFYNITEKQHSRGLKVENIWSLVY